MKKNNKLIAEFMELPTKVFKSGKLNYYFREFNSGSWYEEHELSYNVSWDWLMPVVQKIYQLDKDVDFFGSINFEATYKEVVHFIQEYNETEYKTCDKCSYDNLDDNGDILEHYCEDDELHTPNN